MTNEEKSDFIAVKIMVWIPVVNIDTGKKSWYTGDNTYPFIKKFDYSPPTNLQHALEALEALCISRNWQFTVIGKLFHDGLYYKVEVETANQGFINSSTPAYWQNLKDLPSAITNAIIKLYKEEVK